MDASSASSMALARRSPTVPTMRLESSAETDVDSTAGGAVTFVLRCDRVCVTCDAWADLGVRCDICFSDAMSLGNDCDGSPLFHSKCDSLGNAEDVSWIQGSSGLQVGHVD